MFKKVATLQFKKIYASDNNKDYYWRDFVKQANDKLATDSTFVPKNFYEYNTDKFLYLTARAISSMEKWGPNGNYDAFPWEELKKSYPTFCGKGFYIEHKEDDEKDAKGIILDAQPDDDNEFINCICAISKEEYPEICDDILNGKLNQVSMSCLAAECECSECHNVATKEEELCEHMNPEHPHFCKGSSNLQNKPIYEINRNIVFTGLSGVAVPADKDAFIFDVKASKKSKTSIDKEYNKYLRAKKEYEYINKVLENKDLCRYIISKLEAEQKIQKKANIQAKDYKELLDNIQKAGYEIDEHYYDEEYNDIKAFKDGKEYILEVWVEDYEGPNSYSIINVKDTGKTYKDFGEFLVNSKLKKKASKFVIRDIESGMYFNNDDLVENKENAKQYNTREEAEDEVDRKMHKIINKMQDKERKLEPINSEDYYDVVQITASLNKKAGKFDLSKETIKGMVIDALDLLKSEHTMYNKQFNTSDEVLKVQLEQRDKEYEFFKKWMGYSYGNFVNRHNDTFHKLYTNQISIDEAVERVKALEDQIRNYDPLNPRKKASLKKTADIEYFSDKVQEIPEIDFYTEFMNAGKSKGCNSDINKDQLELGIKVEMEHTTNPVIAEKIACDHIKEIPNYYTLLAEMEASAKANYEAAKQEINKETNEEYPTKLASKQFFKIKKASYCIRNNHYYSPAFLTKDNKFTDLPDNTYDKEWCYNNCILFNTYDEAFNYLKDKFDININHEENEADFYTSWDQHVNQRYEIVYINDLEFNKKSSKQFFKINKSSKKWFKIANIYDDPEERNNIDNYGLSELQRQELQNVIDHIDIVNEDVVVTWDELIESVNQDILDYDFMNKNQANIIDYIENELGQEIEVY